MADKAHHVLDQLPEHRHPIRARMLIDPEFRRLLGELKTEILAELEAK